MAHSPENTGKLENNNRELRSGPGRNMPSPAAGVLLLLATSVLQIGEGHPLLQC